MSKEVGFFKGVFVRISLKLRGQDMATIIASKLRKGLRVLSYMSLMSFLWSPLGWYLWCIYRVLRLSLLSLWMCRLLMSLAACWNSGSRYCSWCPLSVRRIINLWYMPKAPERRTLPLVKNFHQVSSRRVVVSRLLGFLVSIHTSTVGNATVE